MLSSAALPPHRPTKNEKVLADEPFLCLLLELQLISFASESCLFEGTAIIPLWPTALMNAFQPSLPCFPASHYQSVELIRLLTAGAIMRLLSLISSS